MDIFTDNDLEQNLQKYLKKGVEIEAKFRGKFNNIEHFIDLFDKKDYTVKETYTVDYYSSNERICEQDGSYYLTTKTDLAGFPQIYNYNSNSIKLSVSEEKSEIGSKPDSYFMVRKKTRTSFIKDNISIDITHVEENENIKWEVEVEVIDPLKFDYTIFIQSVRFMFDSLVNIDYNIRMFFNGTLGKKRGDVIDYSNISKARDLHIADLTNDGLLDDYAISPKADGKLYFLLFHASGIWLISTTDLIRISLLGNKYRSYQNTIYVGELLEKSGMKKGETFDSNQLFLTFDTIIYKGKIIHLMDYKTRQSYFEKLEIILNDQFLLDVQIKTIINLGTTSDEFCKNNVKAFEIEANAPYKTDGLIYTPNKSGYIAEAEKIRNLKPEDRKLGIYTDVCKYKLPENLTIDFLVQNGRLLSKSSGRNLPFKGNQRWVFNSTNYEVTPEYENKVVEFSPLITENKIIYKPIRIREDKKYPNNMNTAMDLWKLIHDPIVPETLTCKDVKLMRKFNNQVKTKIIDQISGFVVDIGAGKGGDIPKFLKNKKVKKVVAIEPNKEFVTEYTNRLDKMKTYNKFSLLNSGGEDYDKILEFSESNFPQNMNEEDLNITFMISLSFFWSSSTFLNKLSTTITKLIGMYKSRRGNKNINIYYFSIIGSKVKQLFKNMGPKINLNTIRLEEISDNSYFVDIEDSVTVYDQTEYYVDLDQLWNLTGFELVSKEELISDLPGDYILSSGQKLYNSLFEYGQVTYTGSKEDKTKCTRLDVNTNIGIPFEGGVAAKNDDEMESTVIDKDLYRIATIDNGESLYHSIMKMLSKKYRNSGAETRVKMACALKKQVNNSENLSYISKKIGHNIVLFEGKKKTTYGSENKNILLNLCQDNTYEPLAYKNGEDFVFTIDNYSFLL